jgi:hypothetical protein
MIKDKVTMQDLFSEFLLNSPGTGESLSLVTAAFYAGAAAMALQFATNGILYLPNQSGSPDLTIDTPATGESQGSAETHGDLI